MRKKGNLFLSVSCFFINMLFPTSAFILNLFEYFLVLVFVLYQFIFIDIITSPNWKVIKFGFSTKMGPNKQFWSVWAMVQLVHTKPSLISHWTNFCGENVANKDPVALLLYQSLCSIAGKTFLPKRLFSQQHFFWGETSYSGTICTSFDKALSTQILEH